MDPSSEAKCIKLAKLLRGNKKLKTSEGIMAEKRVEVFRGFLVHISLLILSRLSCDQHIKTKQAR